VQPKKKKRHVSKEASTPNEKDMSIRAGGKWEFDLENVHGLSDLETCICVGIVAKYQSQDSFPDSEPGENYKYVDFARKWWHLIKELWMLLDKYPQESGEQTKINGTWQKISSEATLQQLRTGRERKKTERERKLSLRG
jgi:hypothetical protein